MTQKWLIGSGAAMATRRKVLLALTMIIVGLLAASCNGAQPDSHEWDFVNSRSDP